METSSQVLMTLGGMLLLGLFTDLLGRRTPLPRVTLLLLFGVLVGHEVLDLVPPVITERFDLFANMALLMVGFLLGGNLTQESLQRSGRDIMCLSVSTALVASLVVFSGLLLAGVTLDMAILLGCIAAATDPAATVDTVMETGQTGPFTDILLKIVALDDVWGLVFFSVGMAIVTALGSTGGMESPLLMAVWDIGGAVVLGAAVGLPAAYLTGRIRQGQPMLTEALAIVFLCGGLALWLDVSFLIASMAMGAVVANLAKHHDYPFHAIEGIEWPFMVIFFVLAGASLEISALKDIGLIGVVYVLCRAAGKLLGAMAGGLCSRADRASSRWVGVALLPQAGAAMGMALVAANQFPEYRQALLSVVISTTVFFELIGPVFTRHSVYRAVRGKKESKS